MTTMDGNQPLQEPAQPLISQIDETKLQKSYDILQGKGMQGFIFRLCLGAGIGMEKMPSFVEKSFDRVKQYTEALANRTSQILHQADMEPTEELEYHVDIKSLNECKSLVQKAREQTKNIVRVMEKSLGKEKLKDKDYAHAETRSGLADFKSQSADVMRIKDTLLGTVDESKVARDIVGQFFRMYKDAPQQKKEELKQKLLDKIVDLKQGNLGKEIAQALITKDHSAGTTMFKEIQESAFEREMKGKPATRFRETSPVSRLIVTLAKAEGAEWTKAAVQFEDLNDKIHAFAEKNTLVNISSDEEKDKVRNSFTTQSTEVTRREFTEFAQDAMETLVSNLETSIKNMPPAMREMFQKIAKDAGSDIAFNILILRILAPSFIGSSKGAESAIRTILGQMFQTIAKDNPTFSKDNNSAYLNPILEGFRARISICKENLKNST